jgi:hypothetical protein
MVKVVCVALISAWLWGCSEKEQEPDLGGVDTAQLTDNKATDTPPIPSDTPPNLDTTTSDVLEDVETPGDTLGPVDVPQVEDTGVEDTGVEDTDTPKLPEPAELPVEVYRKFSCESVGDEMVVADVENEPGAQVVIKPTADPCTYHLVYRESAGDETTLSMDPAGYLQTIAILHDGLVLVCVNRIDHTPLDDGSNLHYIDGASIACAVKADGAWSALTPVVVPKGEWAAWVKDLNPVPDKSGVYTLRFAHDFSYQFMNMSDSGRPEDDGLYDVTLDLGADGVSASDAVKVADKQNPFLDGEAGSWEPTEEEQEEMSEYIDFSEGDCPDGCPEPP